MLNLPVPEAEYRVVKVEATDLQRDMVEKLGNRAEKVRNHQVNPREDNMLKIPMTVGNWLLTRGLQIRYCRMIREVKSMPAWRRSIVTGRRERRKS